MVWKSLSLSGHWPACVLRAAAMANLAAAADAAVATAECSRATWAATAAAVIISSSRMPWYGRAAGLPRRGVTSPAGFMDGSWTFIGSGMSLMRAFHCCGAAPRPATLSGEPKGKGGATSCWRRAHCRLNHSCAEEAKGGGGGVAQSAPAQLRQSVVGVIARSGGCTVMLAVPALTVALREGEPVSIGTATATIEAAARPSGCCPTPVPERGLLRASGGAAVAAVDSLCDSVPSKLRNSSRPCACRQRSPFLQ